LFRSENDDFRRSHYLSRLLHVQTKSEMLQKKLSKDQCLIFKQNVRLLKYLIPYKYSFHRIHHLYQIIS